ncbi:hypothetical protein ACIRRA_28120 [Nocardia sp. NPDC101769]|uniref:hypothetical protein n=1 Tax=Nocardia sp. NPDC101769 TaxID=3364333 RepID=UPI003823414F
MASGKDESADRQVSEGGQPESAGQPDSGFGPSLNDFGPSLNDFGPSLNDFGPAPTADAPGWSPAPAPQIPDLAWRPAGAPPQFRAPDTWQPVTGQYPPVTGMSTGQYPAVDGAGPPASTADVEQTVRIPPGGSQSAAADAAATPRGADPAAAERNSAGGDETVEPDGPVDSWWRSTPSGFPPVPPPESAAAQGESLSWADDPIAKALAPKTPVPERKPESEGSPWRRIGLIAGAAVLVLAVAGAAIFAVTRGKDDTAAGGATTTGGTAPTATDAALSCPAKQDGKLTIGNGAGGTGSSVDAILGFEHAFYVDRNGAKARTFVVPEATTVQPADVIQHKGIDLLKPGTTYCLKIVEVAPESYDVDITEHHADGTTDVYSEHIMTTVRDGKHLIMSIE